MDDIIADVGSKLLFSIEDDVRPAATRKRITKLAGVLLAPTRPGDFNQAWMDLGRKRS